MKNKISGVIGFLVLVGLIYWNMTAFSTQRKSREELIKVRAELDEMQLLQAKLDENSEVKKRAFNQAREDQRRWDRVLQVCTGVDEWVVAYPDRIQSSYGNEPMGKRTVRIYVPEGKHELIIKFRVDPFGTLSSMDKIEKEGVDEPVESRTLALEGGKSYELEIEFLKSDKTVDEKGYGDVVLTEMRITIVDGEVFSFPFEPASKFSSGQMGSRVRIAIPGRYRSDLFPISDFEIGTLTYGLKLSESDKIMEARLGMFVRSEGPSKLMADDREFQYLLINPSPWVLQFDEEKSWYCLPLSRQETQAGE